MKVAIVGSGPAALTAMWAAMQRHDTSIDMFSPADDGPLNAGVFYLHDPMDLPLRVQEIEIRGFGGTAADYAAKVYGDSTVETSFPVSADLANAWDAMQAFELLRDVRDTSAIGRIKQSIAWQDFDHLSQQYDLVVNTAPLSALGLSIDLTQSPWSSSAWVKAGVAPADECYMLYSAHPAVEWYRCSAVHGRFTMERATRPVDETGWRRVVKVERTPALGQLPANVLLTGRNGAWDKHKLTHHVFDDVIEAMR